MVKVGSRRLSYLPKIRLAHVIWTVAAVIGSIYGWIYLKLGSHHETAAANGNSGTADDAVLQAVHPTARGAPENTDAKTIGYFVSVTGCGSDSLVDAAAVVQHSVRLAHERSKYKYKMHALYHPAAALCAEHLKDVGYLLIKRATINVQEIQGDFLRAKIVENGCCGEKELIKLEAYTFTEYPVVVHVDLDVLVLKSLDNLFDAMLGVGDNPISKVELMWPDQPVPAKINAFFTRDFGMVRGGRKYKPVQGGFLVLRPSIDVYNELMEIVRQGNFLEGKGWVDEKTNEQSGVFYGSMTVQGLLPFFYDILHPHESVDLNRCVYDQMCDNPRDGKTVDDIVHGKCRTGEQECEDYRSRPLENISFVHFTLCQKPWLCLQHAANKIQHRLCRKLFHEWYRIRSDLERSWSRSGVGPAANGTNNDRDHFFGYCTSTGMKGYIPIAKPYGGPAVYN